MATAVNLDALIPREDFAVDAHAPPIAAQDRFSITDLEQGFLVSTLRKPDFQRETIHWTPQKVVDLVRAFVDMDLIPAVILWRAGRFVFVIDGAHRLSALLAWVLDDYGDRKRSLDYFGGNIPLDQVKAAERTRSLVKKEIGSYAEYIAHRANPASAPPKMQPRLSNLAVNTVIAQWVPATDARTAEDSFFKINQAATPIDATERRILRSRKSASAITARAITRAGTGHRYWSPFSQSIREEIEKSGRELHHALYDPPIAGMPLTTLDVPVAGKGYNALPFVFDFVNDVNGVQIKDSTSKKDQSDKLTDDLDGQETLSYLKVVRRRIQRLTTNHPGSLGVHPIVYFYTRGGAFQPTAFLATSTFFEDLDKRNGLFAFTKVRKPFEDFLVEHKEALSLLVHRLGSGGRSSGWLQIYMERVLEGFTSGKNGAQIQDELSRDDELGFVTVPRSKAERPSGNASSFSPGTKTAAFFAAALPQGTRCSICGALVHKNSITFDHIQRVQDGGGPEAGNAGVSHPYCNSTFKEQGHTV